MTILCIGSINIDNAYQVDRHPEPGETVLSGGHVQGLGGKGANMSLAAAALGGNVRHVGAIGADGVWCRERLAAGGVDITGVHCVDDVTGHAVIMVDLAGENIIVVHSGANHALTQDQIDTALAECVPGDWVLLQNETNLVPEAAKAARAAGMKVAYAAAPFDPSATACVMPYTDLLAVNEVEAAQLADHMGRKVETLDVPALLVTQGARGATYRAGSAVTHSPAFPVVPVDTTGAGDTFLGAMLAGLDMGHPPEPALRRASAAAALQVTQPGAGEAIPTLTELEAFLAEHA